MPAALLSQVIPSLHCNHPPQPVCCRWQNCTTRRWRTSLSTRYDVQGGAIALVHECPPCQTHDAASQQRVAGLSFKTGIAVRGCKLDDRSVWTVQVETVSGKPLRMLLSHAPEKYSSEQRADRCTSSKRYCLMDQRKGSGRGPLLLGKRHTVSQWSAVVPPHR
jgi:hypothetical protein